MSKQRENNRREIAAAKKAGTYRAIKNVPVRDKQDPRTDEQLAKSKAAAGK